MPIIAKNDGQKRELIPAGNYVARCYQMIEIGTVPEQFQGKPVIMHKVRIGWELPEEKRVFKEEDGEQPLVTSKEYTLSMNEKANLRKDLKAWRGQDFTDEEAKAFDITKLVGKACMLNVIHKASQSDATKVYEQIAGITPLPKGFKAPPQINDSFILSYDTFDWNKFNSLPDFIKDKMRTSLEFTALTNGNGHHVDAPHEEEVVDDLPF